ncbi:MAG: hypothetical protein ACE5DY_06430 [Mariprofundaceae bacterium]
MSTGDIIFLLIFFWVLFVGARLAVFSLKIDIRIKKRIWPILIVGLGCLLLGTAWLLKFPLNGYYILAPAIAAIVFTNLRGFYFCEACGRMLAHKNILTAPVKCERCGSDLSHV